MYNHYPHKTLYVKAFIVFIVCIISSCSHEIKNDHVLNNYDANADWTKAQQYYLNANNDSALMYINHALENLDTCNYHKMSEIYILRSKISNNLSMYESAMEYAFKALSVSEHYKLTDKKVAALLCIGNIYFKMYNDEKAEEYYVQAKSIAELNNIKTEMMQVYGALGLLYKATDRNDKAFLFLNQALKMAKKQSDTLNIISYLLHIGDYYINLNRNVDANKIVQKYQQNAKKYLDEAMSLALLKNATSQINFIRICFIRWYRVEKNYTKALEYANEILQNTEATSNNYPILLQVYDHLVAIYSYLGDARYAVAYHQEFYSTMAKQSDYKLHQALQEMSVKYETAEKQLEIENKQAEIENQKAKQLIYIGGLIALGLLLILLVYIIALRTRRTRELAETNALKDKFFSIISHDIKNPVVAQRDSLQILAEHADKLPQQKVTEYHKKLLKSANGLVDLLKNLLNWARIQIGHEVYHPLTFNIITALQSDIDIIKNMAEQKNITFETHLPQKAIITADENMVVTVVRNLLTNAVKFTTEGGKIILEISPCSNSKYLISITDTGIGISEKQLNNLFRLDKVHSHIGTAGEKGTGLGLIVCKEMIEKHNSRLHLDSEDGKGSRFWFEL